MQLPQDEVSNTAFKAGKKEPRLDLLGQIFGRDLPVLNHNSPIENSATALLPMLPIKTHAHFT